MIEKFLQDLDETLGIIVNSLRIDDFASAAMVARAFIKLAWLQAHHRLCNLWDEVRAASGDNFTAALAAFVARLRPILQTIWAELCAWLCVKWSELKIFCEEHSRWQEVISSQDVRSWN
jgi:hypothetical protein